MEQGGKPLPQRTVFLCHANRELSKSLSTERRALTVDESPPRKWVPPCVAKKNSLFLFYWLLWASLYQDTRNFYSVKNVKNFCVCLCELILPPLYDFILEKNLRKRWFLEFFVVFCLFLEFFIWFCLQDAFCYYLIKGVSLSQS